MLIYPYHPLTYVPELDRDPAELCAFAQLSPCLRARRRDNQHRKRTVDAYVRDAARFAAWCTMQDLDARDASDDDVARFLRHLLDDEGVGKGAALQILTAIRQYVFTTRDRFFVDGTALKRIKSECHRRVIKRAVSLRAPQLELLCRTARLREPLHATRDLALFLNLWASSMRPAELTAMHVDWLKPLPRGYVIWIPYSKTDQLGEGQPVTVACQHATRFCPVHCLYDWLNRAEITDGPIFRKVDQWGNVRNKGLSEAGITKIFDQYKRLLHFDRFSPYSFRRGSVTEAFANGATEEQCRRQLRHKHNKSTRTYIDEAPVPIEQSISRMIW